MVTHVMDKAWSLHNKVYNIQKQTYPISLRDKVCLEYHLLQIPHIDKKNKKSSTQIQDTSTLYDS